MILLSEYGWEHTNPLKLVKDEAQLQEAVAEAAQRFSNQEEPYSSTKGFVAHYFDILGRPVDTKYFDIGGLPAGQAA